jgi:hypothetical protein
MMDIQMSPTKTAISEDAVSNPHIWDVAIIAINMITGEEHKHIFSISLNFISKTYHSFVSCDKYQFVRYI